MYLTTTNQLKTNKRVQPFALWPMFIQVLVNEWQLKNFGRIKQNSWLLVHTEKETGDTERWAHLTASAQYCLLN